MDQTSTSKSRDWLTDMAAAGSSDLHLVPGYPPTYRLHGTLRPLDTAPLAEESIVTLLREVLPSEIVSRIESDKNVDCSVAIDDGGTRHRFRANVFRAGKKIGACFRHIPSEIPSFDWMGFPTDLADRIVNLHHGLVVITGITGSGKTTTLASLIDKINRDGGRRIITVEDPIEYVYDRAGTSMITQREVGVDVDSFYDGLVNGLRQDPDVILVGEIRDQDTARMALSAAETGHLILATMHTQDAKGAVTRLVDLFPHDAQQDVRSQLSLSLQYIVCQHLLPNAVEGQKRGLALEILRATLPVRSAIRFGKIESLESSIQTGRREGMLSLDESLSRLATANVISWETARHFAKDPHNLGGY